MRKHRGSSRDTLPTGKQTRKAFTPYWKTSRHIALLRNRLAQMRQMHHEWVASGYAAPAEYVNKKITCLTGIIYGACQEQDRALAQIMGRDPR